MITLTTSDDVELSANLHSPSGNPVGAIVMSHPHPLYGGDQDHLLVVAVCEAMAANGWVALRFDFRGTNASGGTHGGGVDEQLDIMAAVEYLATRLAVGAPLVTAGYSFGAATTFSTIHPKISARVGIALPVSMLKSAPAPLPTLLIHPRHDQFTTVVDLEAASQSWPDVSSSIQVLEGADHFMNGFVDSTAARVASWCSDVALSNDY